MKIFISLDERKLRMHKQRIGKLEFWRNEWKFREEGSSLASPVLCLAFVNIYTQYAKLEVGVIALMRKYFAQQNMVRARKVFPANKNSLKTHRMRSEYISPCSKYLCLTMARLFWIGDTDKWGSPLADEAGDDEPLLEVRLPARPRIVDCGGVVTDNCCSNMLQTLSTMLVESFNIWFVW